MLTLRCNSGSGSSSLATRPRLRRSRSGKGATGCANTRVGSDLLTWKAEWRPGMFLYDWSLPGLAASWSGMY